MHIRSFKRWMTALLVLGASAMASADDAPAPSSATNLPTSPAPVSEGEPLPPASSVGENNSMSLTAEPTFRSETQRRVWPNGPLLATGATVFALSYLPAVVGAALSERNDNDLYIPVAGPWMTLASGPSETRGEKTLLIVDGVAQGLGALMIVSSLFIPRKKTKTWYLIGMAPGHGSKTYGMGAVGRF